MDKLEKQKSLVFWLLIIISLSLIVFFWFFNFTHLIKSRKAQSVNESSELLKIKEDFSEVLSQVKESLKESGTEAEKEIEQIKGEDESINLN